MCGGGGGDQYDAYKEGDFQNWKNLFNQKAAIETQLANGEISQAQADAALAQYGAGSQFEKLSNKIKSDASAGMEQREVSRQHDVGLGRIGIDKAFNKFDDNYYGGYQDNYSGYYMPQLDKQYGEAVDKMTSTLAGRGMLESSVGADTFAKLAKDNADARTNIANEGLDASNKLRGTVENAKSNLYSLNEASANPQAVNAQAIGQATSLVAPPTYSPLGQVFASALGSFGNYVSSKNNTPTRNYQSAYGSPTGYGSGSVVR